MILTSKLTILTIKVYPTILVIVRFIEASIIVAYKQ